MIKDWNYLEKELELFFSSMIYVEDKILALLIQLPPSMGIVEGMTCLGDLTPDSYTSLIYGNTSGAFYLGISLQVIASFSFCNILTLLLGLSQTSS